MLVFCGALAVRKSWLMTVIRITYWRFRALSQNCEKRLLAYSCPPRLSAHLFVRIDQLSFHLREFYEILYWRIFRKSAEKFQV